MNIIFVECFGSYFVIFFFQLFFSLLRLRRGNAICGLWLFAASNVLFSCNCFKIFTFKELNKNQCPGGRSIVEGLLLVLSSILGVESSIVDNNCKPFLFEGFHRISLPFVLSLLSILFVLLTVQNTCLLFTLWVAKENLRKILYKNRLHPHFL